MEDNLIKVLASFRYSVYRQGSMSNDEIYPETFFTFWNNDSLDHSHYDNAEYGTEWDFDVNIYSSNPELTYSVLANARVALKAAGWIIPSKGYDVASDEATHIGRGLNAIYLQVK